MRKRPFLIFVVSLIVALSSFGVAAGEFVAIGSGSSEGIVYAIAADLYSISLGVSNGVKIGDFFLAYYDGGNLTDANGILIGRYKIPVAVLKVENVSTASSECSVVSPSKGWVIQIRDRVMPLTAASANYLRFDMSSITPEKPRQAGYSGRWVRVAPAINPLSVVVQYYYPWTPLEANQPTKLRSPGHYYYKRPELSIRVLNASPQVLPGAVSSISQGVFPAEPPVLPVLPVPVEPPALPVPYDFDVNGIVDLRLVQAFPITQVEMYALEIQHRHAWGLYSKKRYKEALAEFTEHAVLYPGNYLSPYWAGKSALMLNDTNLAERWFHAALGINPYYRPARDEIYKIIANR
jgi:hypothetical protein